LITKRSGKFLPLFDFGGYFKLKFKRQYTEQEKRDLRPIAEMLAIKDGNAFFGLSLDNDMEWYEQYLDDAYDFINKYLSGGIEVLYGRVSWLKDLNHENDAVKEAYENWQLIKKLSQ